MILSELNYLEPVSEANRIVGGISTGTDNTFALAEADTDSDGAVANGLSGAKGDRTSTSALTNTQIHKNDLFKIATAKAGASSTSLSSGSYDSSNAIANSLSISGPHGHKSFDFASSSSIDT